MIRLMRSETHGSIHFRTTLWIGPIGLRFGRFGFRLFSERYGGQYGIPKRHFYLFGGRLTVIKRRKLRRPELQDSGT